MNKQNPYASITPEEHKYILLNAARWQKWAADWKKANARDDLIDPDIHLLAMDIATVHIQKPLNLFQWFLSSDLDFIADAVLIAMFIDRPNLSFPNSIILRFQRSD